MVCAMKPAAVPGIDRVRRQEVPKRPVTRRGTETQRME